MKILVPIDGSQNALNAVNQAKADIQLTIILLEPTAMRAKSFEEISSEDSEKFDAIIIGSRGMSDLKRFFPGSVSTRVSQHAPCTVTLVK